MDDCDKCRKGWWTRPRRTFLQRVEEQWSRAPGKISFFFRAVDVGELAVKDSRGFYARVMVVAILLM